MKEKNYPNFYILSTEKDKIFWTITEVSNRLGLEPYVLRFWEKKFKKIQPTKKSSGTRYYKINDIHLIEKVRDLLYKEGYTIEGAIKALNKKKASSQTVIKSEYKNLIENSNIDTQTETLDIENESATELLKAIKKKHQIEEDLNKISEELTEIEKLLN